MIGVDGDYAFVGDVGGDDFLGVFEVEHFEEEETVDFLFGHGVLSQEFDFFDFVGIFGVEFFFLFAAGLGEFHGVELNFGHG